MSVKWSVTIDCEHPATLAAFWKLALEYVDASPPEGFANWPEWFRAFGVPPEEWDAGAYIEDPGGGIPDHVVMADPEGNEFDVL
jgi:hypothetical protein